jgi:hypothetical protein
VSFHRVSHLTSRGSRNRSPLSNPLRGKRIQQLCSGPRFLGFAARVVAGLFAIVLIESGLQTEKKLVATLGKAVGSLITNEPIADIKKPGPGTGQSTHRSEADEERFRQITRLQQSNPT